jgi:hypothetical protein
MKRIFRVATASLLVAALLASACGALAGGPRKVVLSEAICENVRLLKMKVGVTNRVVLDNNERSENQTGISVSFDDFPVAVVGPVPEGSTIGSPTSTIKLSADPGAKQSVDLQPTFTGTYNATCTIILKKGTSGQQIVQKTVRFQLVK